MDEHAPPRRIGSICAGAGLAVLCGFLAWASFALLTAMMNPALTGANYWAAVRDRASGNPTVTAILALSVAGSVLGFGIVVRAVVGLSHCR